MGAVGQAVTALVVCALAAGTIAETVVRVRGKRAGAGGDGGTHGNAPAVPTEGELAQVQAVRAALSTVTAPEPELAATLYLDDEIARTARRVIDEGV